MSERGIEVHVPLRDRQSSTTSTSRTACSLQRPGDPAATTGQMERRGALGRDPPYFGICFGNQLFGRALGFGTYLKLKYGHRGINQPVRDLTTDQGQRSPRNNHGSAVTPRDTDTETPYGVASVSHVCLKRRRRSRPRAARPGGGQAGLLRPVPSRGICRPARQAYLFDRFVSSPEETA